MPLREGGPSISMMASKHRKIHAFLSLTLFAAFCCCSSNGSVIVTGKPPPSPIQHQPAINKLYQQRRYSFKENCADEPDSELVTCTVSAVDCAVNIGQLFPPFSSIPGEAHDLRIEPFAKATPRRLAAALQNNNNGNGTAEMDGNAAGNTANGHHHQLLVDISWQTAPNNSTRALRGFLLEIEGENGRKHACFLLNLSSTVWNEQTIAASPRLHFTTDSVFSFAQNYEIELYSLPERSIGTGASVHTRFTTPHNPNSAADGQAHPNTEMVSANCTKQSNQYASKWTAGFRHIYIHSAARIMQVEFVGAPPQYCFEQYEVRLLDETGLELLYSGTVSVDEMQRNGSMILGQYNFTDLEYDSSYIPSVIPVERAADGRCLCPVFGTDPYDMTVVCSCVAADWKPVRMSRPDVVKLSPNSSAAILPPIDHGAGQGGPHGASRDGNVNFWICLLIVNLVFLVVIFLLIGAYLRHKFINDSLGRKGQFHGRIRFVPAKQNPNANGTMPLCNQNVQGNGGSSANCNLVPPLVIRSTTTLPALAKTMMDTGNGSSSTMPLIGNDEAHQQLQCGDTETPMMLTPINLLIVYAHDGAAHERAVMALAEFLRDVFNVNVQLDRWQIAQIEANLTDWLSASVVCADKVLIVNSRGAWERYHAKCTSQGRWSVERSKADLLDHLFIAHIDMALQHHSIVSTRFGYTSTQLTLPMLSDRLQYILPNNIVPLVSALFGSNMRQDFRLQDAELANTEVLVKLRQAMDEMSQLCRDEPDWFALTHQRRWQHVQNIQSQNNDKIGQQIEEGGKEDTGIGTMVDGEQECGNTIAIAKPLTTLIVDETCAKEEEDRVDSGLLSMEQTTPRIPLLEIATKKHVDFAKDQEGEEEMLEAGGHLLMMKQQPLLDGGDNNGKMDSGIFEWSGTGGSASGDDDEEEEPEKKHDATTMIAAQKRMNDAVEGTKRTLANNDSNKTIQLEEEKITENVQYTSEPVAQLIASEQLEQQTFLPEQNGSMKPQHKMNGIGMFGTNANDGIVDDSGVLFTSSDMTAMDDACSTTTPFSPTNKNHGEQKKNTPSAKSAQQILAAIVT